MPDTKLSNLGAQEVGLQGADAAKAQLLMMIAQGRISPIEEGSV